MPSIGINFRANDAPYDVSGDYVTDGAGESYCGLGGAPEQYPITRVANWSYGWAADDYSDVSVRDRNQGIGAHFAGIHYAHNNYTKSYTFQVTLPSTGEYEIRAAFGDASAEGYIWAEFKDGSTVFATIHDAGNGSNGAYVAADSFIDATGVTRTRADWPANNSALTRTFASTAFTIEIGAPTGSNGTTCPIAHLSIASVEGGPALVDYIPGAVVNRGGWTDQDDSTDDADVIAAFEAVRNDATYVKSPTNPTVDNYLEVELRAVIGGGPVEVPAVGTDHTLIYTMCADGILNAKVELRADDGYVVDERTFTPIAQNGVAGTPEFYVTGTLTLDAGQVALLVEHGYDGAKFRFTPGITV